jgi:hypothetical protein
MDVSAQQTSAFDADGEVALSRPPDAGVKSRATKHEATVARTPGAPRRPRISRKPLRRGCRLFGCPVVSCVRKVHYSLHARLAGAASIRHSLRPLFQEGHELSKTRAKSCRGNAFAWLGAHALTPKPPAPCRLIVAYRCYRDSMQTGTDSNACRATR